MKFLDFYLSSGTRTVSVFIGTLVGLVTALFTDWMIGTLTGACVVILASVIVPLVLYREERPYNAAKEAGLVRSEGKEYVMKDGDVVLFRFNV